MSAHKENQACYYKAVEDKACHTVGIKPGAFDIMIPHRHDNMKNHRSQNQEHTKYDGYHEYGVHLTNHRKRHHSFLGLQPAGRKHILETEEAAVHETEEGREDTGAADNRRQIHALLLIQEETAQQQYQALSHIAEHGAEDKGIGDGYEHGRIHLIVGRKSIHLHIHLEGTENLQVMKLRGRGAEDIVMVILHHHEGLLVILNLLLEGVCLILRHPAAEDIKHIVLLLGQGCVLPDIEACAALFQVSRSGCQLIDAVCHNGSNLLIHRHKFLIQLCQLFFQLFVCMGRRSFVLIRNKDMFKMHGRVHRVNLIR